MIPAHEDISALRLALWDLGEAAKDYLEKQTEETERRLRNRLAKAERARDLSHQHEREREEPRHGTPRKLDGETALGAQLYPCRDGHAWTTSTGAEPPAGAPCACGQEHWHGPRRLDGETAPAYTVADGCGCGVRVG